MLVLPIDDRVGYSAFLTQRGVSQIYLSTGQKWLRYYLDFCKKSRHETATSRGLDAFLVKVPGKKKIVQLGKRLKGLFSFTRIF